MLVSTVIGVLAPLHASPGDDIEPLVGVRYFTAWTFPPWAVIPILLTAALYLWGVHRLHQRGDQWPISRTLMFVALGCGSLLIAICSFLGVYDTVLFWLHMVQHMLLNMIAPVFLVAGAPVTLALRTLPVKGRKALLKVLHSGFVKVLTFPPLVTALMIGSPFALYMTGWYDLTLRNDLAHDLLHVWLVFVGCVFFFPLLGVDPVPIKMAYPIRILLFMLTMPFHAFLGIIIMSSERLIAEEWYVSFERSWGMTPLRDQTWAGGLMWATGDLTAFAAMLTIFVQWIKDSKREARRVDRALDREEALAAKRAGVGDKAPVRYDADNNGAERTTTDPK